MGEMDNSCDFLQWLGADLSIKILTHLDDPSDLVRVCLVTSSWRQFVIENSLSRQLCLRLFPDLSGALHFIELKDIIDTSTVRSSNVTKCEYLKRIHTIYLLLAKSLSPSMRKDCISVAIGASTTDNYPEESINNTLEPGDRIHQASYWSSLGAEDADVLETLTYELVSNLCVVSEIHIQPFQVYFEYGFPIYSSRAVRFKMGHPKYSIKLDTNVSNDAAVGHESESEHFIWTYVSPEFPVVQENTLQIFKLPEPVFCVGGVLQVELLGRVQKHEMDGLYYLCVSHVQVVGRPLLPGFDVDILNHSGKCVLKYCPKILRQVSSNGDRGHSRLRTIAPRLVLRDVQGWEQMVLNALLGGGVVDDDDYEADEETAAW